MFHTPHTTAGGTCLDFFSLDCPAPPRARDKDKQTPSPHGQSSPAAASTSQLREETLCSPSKG